MGRCASRKKCVSPVACEGREWWEGLVRDWPLSVVRKDTVLHHHREASEELQGVEPRRLVEVLTGVYYDSKRLQNILLPHLQCVWKGKILLNVSVSGSSKITSLR